MGQLGGAVNKISNLEELTSEHVAKMEFVVEDLMKEEAEEKQEMVKIKKNQEDMKKKIADLEAQDTDTKR